MQLTGPLKAGAAALCAVLVGGIIYGQLSPGPEAPAGHLSIPGAAEGSYYVRATLQASAASEVAVMRLAPEDAREELALAGVCALPVDGGVDPGQYALPGMTIVSSEVTGTLCVAGVDPQLEVWLQRRPDAPWPCACAKGPACSWTHQVFSSGWGSALKTVTDAAPPGRTLAVGTWSGPDCVAKACSYFAAADAGDLSWPAACPH